MWRVLDMIIYLKQYCRVWYGLLALILFMCFMGCSDNKDSSSYIMLNDDTLGKVKIHIAQFYQNRKAAISLTFDDGMRCHAMVAAPALEERGLRGTFFVYGRNILPTRSENDYTISQTEIRYMTERGHEISNHTFNHIKMTNASEDSIRRDLAKNDSLIELWTGKRPVTFAFPYNARNDMSIRVAKEGRVGVRTFETGFGGNVCHSTYEDMVNWAEDKIKKMSWGVAMLHGINEGYDGWEDPEPFFLFLDYLKEKESELWVETFRDVCAYREEANAAKLHATLVDGVLKGYAECKLDVSLFNHPLTLVITTSKQEVILKDIMPNHNFQFVLK